jgi:hypothetical protein
MVAIIFSSLAARIYVVKSNWLLKKSVFPQKNSGSLQKINSGTLLMLHRESAPDANYNLLICTPNTTVENSGKQEVVQTTFTIQLRLAGDACFFDGCGTKTILVERANIIANNEYNDRRGAVRRSSLKNLTVR